MAPRDATKVNKDVRTQEQGKRRRTPGTMYTERRHVDEGSRKEEKGSWSQADGDGITETRGNPNPKLGKTGHGDRSRKPETRWGDIGHGREDDLHNRRRTMQ